MKNKKLSYTKRKAMYGRAFISIWAIGLVMFFIIPFIRTFIYSLCDTTLVSGGMDLEFVGTKMYFRAFRIDTNPLPKLTTTFTNLLYSVPITVMFSLFIAVVLNAKFVGRTFFRAVFFMPVVVMSGIILVLFKSDSVAMMLFNSSGDGNDMFENITVLQELFTNLGWGEEILGFIQGVIGRVLDVCWSCGVQYILCLAALQGIPDSLYEVARVEGATKWEEFWKLTFPMCTPVLFVCVIFTIVENASGGAFTAYIKTVSFANFEYGYGSALAMVYCVIVLFIIGITSFVLRNWFSNSTV